MSIERSLKDFSPRQIEEALAKGLTELVGREYTVSLGRIDFAGPAALVGRVPLEITVMTADDPSIPL